MAWRDFASFTDVDIQGSVVTREGVNAGSQGGLGQGVKAKLAAGTTTIVGAGTAVEANVNYTLHGAAGATLKDKGFTVNATDDRIDVDFIGTKMCHIYGAVSLAPVATNTDNLNVSVYLNNTTVLFVTADQDVADTGPAFFAFDFYDTLTNGDYINLWVANTDTTANIILAVYAELGGVSGAVDPEAGYLAVYAV